MKTITKTQTFTEGDRAHNQSVSIDLNDNFMVINHNGDEILLSTESFDKLIKLYKKCLTLQQ